MNVYTIADEINAPKKNAKGKKPKKGKAGKKLLFGIAFINLLPIRAAFNTIVAANFNAIAHNLKWIHENRNGITKENWNKIRKIWKKIGGPEKALLKAIKIGAKHKPLFLSKKAKARYNKKVEARSKATGTKPIKGIYLYEEGINAAPVIAAAIAAASGVIAAMIPPIMNALKKGGKPQQEAAQEVQTEAQSMVQQFQESPTQYGKQVEEGADMQTEEIGELDSINDGGMDSLFSALGKVAEGGIKAAGNAIARKAAKKPKVKQFLEKAGTGADDYLTGRYLRQAGYTGAAKSFSATIGGGGNMLLIGGAAAAAIAAFFLIKKK